MIYPYAISESETAVPPPSARGLGGARLHALETEGLAAVYSRHRSLRLAPKPRLVLAHERVVEAVMARGSVLPMRFGTQLDDEERLAASLTGRREELRRMLDRVRGYLELGLRVSDASPVQRGHDGERSGQEFLRALTEAKRRKEQVARELHEPLAALAVASVTREVFRPPAILAAAYLIDPLAVGELHRRAEEFAAGRRDLQVVVTGPWPPYSFSAIHDP